MQGLPKAAWQWSHPSLPLPVNLRLAALDNLYTTIASRVHVYCTPRDGTAFFAQYMLYPTVAVPGTLHPMVAATCSKRAYINCACQDLVSFCGVGVYGVLWVV
jgi:hypothetical protein